LKIGAAFDSLILVLGLAAIMTISVMALAIWRGVLSGNLKTSFILRKPLVVPSLVFTFTIIITMTTIPIPMSAYHGINQLLYSDYSYSSFRVYEAGVYDADTLVRVARNVEPDDWIEIYAYFSQEETVIGTLFINMTEDILDTYGGVTRTINLEPGWYEVSTNVTFFDNGVEQEEYYLDILINQPVVSSFLPEITSWSSFLVILGIVCVFLILGGLCIGREGRTRRSEEDVDQEPPREGEVYVRRW
jgi:hypothetical protein